MSKPQSHKPSFSLACVTRERFSTAAGDVRKDGAERERRRVVAAQRLRPGQFGVVMGNARPAPSLSVRRGERAAEGVAAGR